MWNKYFKLRKVSETFSESMINELEPVPTISENVYFVNHRQSLLPVFTAVFHSTHAEHNLIKLNLYNNWSAQAVNSISECAIYENQRNISNLLAFKN